MLKIKKTIGFILVSLLVIFSCYPNSVKANANIYYVATNDINANDTNDGLSLSNPFKTIQKAANIMVPGDICYIREGIYRETVTPFNNGTSLTNIKFLNYNNESVIVSGADKVTNPWTLHNGNIYKTNVNMNLGDKNQVFVNENMVNEARWPNAGSDLMLHSSVTVDSGTATSIVDADLEFDDNSLIDAKIWCVGGYEWIAQTSTIIGNSNSSNTLTFNNFNVSSSSYNPKSGNHYYIFGKLNLLDSDNEWFFDSSSSTLYLQAPNGEDPNNLNIEIKSRNNAFNLCNKSYIEIEGINIFASTISMNDNTNYCTINSINAKYISHSNNNSSGYTSQADLGILLKGNYNKIKNSIFDYSSSCIINTSGNNNSIVNCLINNANYSGTNLSAIYGAGDALLISNNTISNTGRAALTLTVTKSQIQYNDIYNTGCLTKDCGAIYLANSSGQNTRIHHNKIHDNKTEVFASGIYLY